MLDGVNITNDDFPAIYVISAANALSPPGGDYLEHVTSQNDKGSVSAASFDGKPYVYPETSDNGYFLYYDKSVIQDPSTLEGMPFHKNKIKPNIYTSVHCGLNDDCGCAFLLYDVKTELLNLCILTNPRVLKKNFKKQYPFCLLLHLNR